MKYLTFIALFYIYNINVHMHQPQETIISNNISKQIKSRKSNEQNSIQPFKSHRKRVDQNQVLMPIPQNQHTNYQQASKYKLSRNYPAQTSHFNASESKKKSQRFKYDFNNLDHSEVREQQGKKYISNVNSFESQAIVNRYSTSKKNSLADKQLKMTRNEVKSILFDSRVEPYESRYMASTRQIQIQNDRQINMFKEKVNKVNNEIEAGINNLQKMIERLKQKKVTQKSGLKPKDTVQSKLQRSLEIKSQQNDKLILKFGEQNRLASRSLLSNPLNQAIASQVEPEAKVTVQQINQPVVAERQRKKQPIEAASSQIPLSGQFKSKLPKFPSEYTSLINRLAFQIQIDMEFTNNIAQLTKNGQLPRIKALILEEIKKYEGQVVDETYFQIEPHQVDPLEANKPYFIVTMKEEDEADLAIRLFKKYKQMQSHFESKLKEKFNPAIIKLLFEELAKFNSTKAEEVKTVTIGHLLSYLNMRTNKSFRNRYFVKLAKRLELKPNSNLTIDSFQKLITLI